MPRRLREASLVGGTAPKDCYVRMRTTPNLAAIHKYDDAQRLTIWTLLSTTVAR